MNVTATPNANLTTLGGESVHDNTSTEYQEYRRCWIDYPSNFILRDFPLHLDIEATNRCNLRCTFCDKLPLLTKDQFGDIDLNLYKKIIDEGTEKGLWGVKLSYRGEPLLHKNIAEMVSYAKQKGILDIYFNSNGMLLNEEIAKKFIDSGLDRISISIEGTKPDSFEKERRGAKFYKIMKNIDALLELRAQKNATHPKIRIQTVALPDIDLEEYARFWAPHCDETACIDYKDVEDRNVTLIDSEWACPQLWQRMTIEWDGTIMPCNNDDFRYLSPGNVRSKDVQSCWHDPVVKEARTLHKQGKSHLLKSCNGCPWRTTQILKKNENK